VTQSTASEPVRENTQFDRTVQPSVAQVQDQIGWIFEQPFQKGVVLREDLEFVVRERAQGRRQRFLGRMAAGQTVPVQLRGLITCYDQNTPVHPRLP
jgi:hypothetical protein